MSTEKMYYEKKLSDLIVQERYNIFRELGITELLATSAEWHDYIRESIPLRSFFFDNDT